MTPLRQALIRELLTDALAVGPRPIIRSIVDDIIMEVYGHMPYTSKVSDLLGVNHQRVGQARARATKGREAA